MTVAHDGRRRRADLLQFGHSVAAVDDPTLLHGQTITAALQFGHSVAAVDDMKLFATRGKLNVASIRPQRRRRG